MSLPQAWAAAAATPEGSPVPSPCVSLCRIDAASGLCEGCWRSLDEIAAWSRMSDADKRQVWQTLALRRVQWPMPPQRTI